MITRSGRIVQFLCLAGFGLALFVFFVNVADVDPAEIALWEFYLEWLARGSGLFIATASALALLLMAVGGTSAARLGPILLSLLGGMALMYPQWFTIVILGALALAILVWEILRERPAAPAVLHESADKGP
jgi:hypothetical protein